ncbi:hypothetical protein [Noviherbaspirillum pedocola]|uniref:Uncharacterized protein n=1 Tax=Noviherbaspirillum pedocola TaxID=2801341 RepID=A0A934SYV8_9BURK|nr:hypothetical protein [Noviherbaspirillum pedocola]MBK4737556.1 hypothetical protein [Noviherbaspirillum pedocola]
MPVQRCSNLAPGFANRSCCVTDALFGINFSTLCLARCINALPGGLRLALFPTGSMPLTPMCALRFEMLIPELRRVCHSVKKNKHNEIMNSEIAIFCESLLAMSHFFTAQK